MFIAIYFANLTKIKQRLGFESGLTGKKITIIMIIIIIIINKTNNAVASFIMRWVTASYDSVFPSPPLRHALISSHPSGDGGGFEEPSGTYNISLPGTLLTLHNFVKNIGLPVI